MLFIRLKWLDIAKGITIILMVIGHTSIPDPFSRFIYAFHMPLFFIASGWTTNWNKYNYMEFAKRKFRSIMVPFMVYSVIVLSIQTISMGGGKFFTKMVCIWLARLCLVVYSSPFFGFHIG